MYQLIGSPNCKKELLPESQPLSDTKLVETCLPNTNCVSVTVGMEQDPMATSMLLSRMALPQPAT